MQRRGRLLGAVPVESLERAVRGQRAGGEDQGRTAWSAGLPEHVAFLVKHQT